MSILEMSFRDVEKTEAIEELIQEKASKLEQVRPDLISCRVAVERPQRRQRTGNPFRVRVDLSVPGEELVVKREPSEGDMHDPLPKVVRDTFRAARRLLKEHGERQRGEVKTHPEQERVAFVVRLFREDGYGFLRTVDNEEIYFHGNSVLHGDFERLEIGTGVRYVEEAGEKGPQASSVQIVDKPGAQISKAEEAGMEPPLGWKR